MRLSLIDSGKIDIKYPRVAALRDLGRVVGLPIQQESGLKPERNSRAAENNDERYEGSSLKSFRNSLNAERGLFQDGGFGQRTKFSNRGRNQEPKYVETP
ncbi:hypothetical protein KM043_015390 [Ampulex compressa]|nr:hypothetical protein KM043_015390 [Ampulex compressa]